MNERDEIEIKEAVKRLDPKVLTEIVKSAIKELLREQAENIGWWVLRSAGVLIVGGSVLLVLKAYGYHK